MGSSLCHWEGTALGMMVQEQGSFESAAVLCWARIVHQDTVQQVSTMAFCCLEGHSL